MQLAQFRQPAVSSIRGRALGRSSGGLLLPLVARFFGRAADFNTRFFVFALLVDLALLLAFADRFVFAFLAMRVAPLLQ
jgi:hypothetical protein